MKNNIEIKQRPIKMTFSNRMVILIWSLAESNDLFLGRGLET